MPAFRYRFGGLDVSTNSAVRGLRGKPAISGKPDLLIEFRDSAGPTPDCVKHAWGGRYDLRLGTSGPHWWMGSRLDGTFLIEADAGRIHVYCSGMPPAQEVMDVLSRRVLPRVSTFSGALAIHAAAVSKGDTGLLLLGASGAGKSTTVAYLGQTAGWEILSDDFSILREPTAPLIEPGTTGVCLWSESREALGLDPAWCCAMPGYEGKIRFEPPHDHRLSPARLKAFVVLERRTDCDAPAIRPLTRSEALIAAVRQLVLFDPSAPPHVEKAVRIGQLNEMMRTVPSYGLTMPARFSALAAAVPLLERLLAA